MYIAMRDGLFESRDAGRTWSRLAPGLRNMAAVAVNPTRTEELWAVTEDGALHWSRDGGKTWATKR
jgi:photosystem II stability/assembly factor-like uncharacterized protein